MNVQQVTSPSIKKRYFSMLIDMLVVLAITLGLISLFYLLGLKNDYLRGITLAGVVLLYEPILISCSCTIGQWLTNIRVRSRKDRAHKINIFQAFVRLFV